MNSNQLNDNEFAPFYRNYIKNLGSVNLYEILTNSLDEMLTTLQNLPEDKLLYSYAEGKWTIKELVQHIIDAERVFCYRALRFSRNDATNLPGFNEDWYVENSNGNDRDFNDLLNEFVLVRNSTISLFNSFTSKMLTLKGAINNSDMSVRALGFIIAGHQTHHLKIIKEKYL
tara:strand:+ start:35 stop:550 length:516 start_codon:yes stop_codon:yes gene_type:complete